MSFAQYQALELDTKIGIDSLNCQGPNPCYSKHASAPQALFLDL